MLRFTYCEATPFLFVEQPFNSASNLAFFAAVYFLLRHREPLMRQPREIRLPLLCMLLVGVGSTIWHTVQFPWTLWLDMLPILAFLVLFQYHFTRKYFGLDRRGGVGAVAAILAACAGASLVANEIFLQKANAFVPVALWMFVAAGLLWKRQKHAARMCFFAGAAFSLAILMRITDVPVCHGMPHGTHYLWHMLSALTMYFTMRALMGGKEKADEGS